MFGGVVLLETPGGLDRHHLEFPTCYGMSAARSASYSKNSVAPPDALSVPAFFYQRDEIDRWMSQVLLWSRSHTHPTG